MRRFLPLWVFVVLPGIGCAGKVPLPSRLAGLGTAEIRQRIVQARPQSQAYAASVHVSYFGAQGRVQVAGSLVVQQPDRLRLDLQGPHGGVVRALAVDGNDMTMLDVASDRFFYGPANAATIDDVLDVAPLGLPPSAWVCLLFGIVDIPDDAVMRYDDKRGVFVFRWLRAAMGTRVDVDARSLRPVRVQICGGVSEVDGICADAARASEVVFLSRDAGSLPQVLRLQVPGRRVEAEVALTALRRDLDFPVATFRIAPPQGITPKYLAIP